MLVNAVHKIKHRNRIESDDKAGQSDIFGPSAKVFLRSGLKSRSLSGEKGSLAKTWGMIISGRGKNK